jgi:hypothetical protein
MNVQILKERVHNDFLHIKKIKYLIDSENFKCAWELAPVKSRKELLNNVSLNTLKEFIKKHNSTPFAELGVRRLRIMAKHCKIEYYSKLDKYQLIREIENVVSRIKKSSQ